MFFQETSSSKTKYEHEIARIKAVLGQLQHENRELRVLCNQQGSSSSNSHGAAVSSSNESGGDKDAFNAFR